MSVPVSQDVNDIIGLIDAGRTAEARRKLSVILFRDSKNVDAWWLFAQVAEDPRQQLKCLNVVANTMAPNPYSDEAKEVLAKLSIRGIKQTSPKVQVRKQSIFGRREMFMIVGVLSVGIMLIGLLTVLSSPSTPTAIAAEITDVPAQVEMEVSTATAPAVTTIIWEGTSISKVVVTVTAFPTDTKAASTTMPTRFATRRPSATPRPMTATATATPVPSVAELLPPLHDELADKFAVTISLEKVLTTTLKDLDSVSPEALLLVNDQISQIQQMRNQVMMTITKDVPKDVRQKIVNPAQRAYIDYANALLNWAQLRLDLIALKGSLASTKADELSAAIKKLTEQSALAEKRAAAIQTQREKLDLAMTDYALAVFRMTQDLMPSDEALVVVGATDRALKLDKGTYQVFFHVDKDVKVDGPTSASLVQNSDPTTRIKLSTDKKMRSITVEKAGLYTLNVANPGWFVLVLDPA